MNNYSSGLKKDDRILYKQTSGKRSPGVVLEDHEDGQSVLIQLDEAWKPAIVLAGKLTREQTVSKLKVNDLVYVIDPRGSTHMHRGKVYQISYIGGGMADVYSHNESDSDSTFVQAFYLEDLARYDAPKPVDNPFNVGDEISYIESGIVRGIVNASLVNVEFPREDRLLPIDSIKFVKAAPKPKPTLGSVWLYDGVTKYVYIGNQHYARLNGVGHSIPAIDFEDSTFVPVKV